MVEWLAYLTVVTLAVIKDERKVLLKELQRVELTAVM
jgi:hypothetical protein